MAPDLSESHQAVRLLTSELTFLTIYLTSLYLLPPRLFIPRLLTVLLLAYLTYASLQPALFPVLRPQWRTAAMNGIWMQFLSAADILLFARVDFAKLNTITYMIGKKKQRIRSGLGARGWSAVCLLWNMRRVGTEWEVRGLRRETVVSRARWVAGRMAQMAVAYLVLDAICLGPPPPRGMMVQGKDTLWPGEIGKLSGEELGFRVATTLGFGLSAGLLVLIMQLGIAVVCVVTGLGRPEDFPPYFGWLWEASSVGRFWSLLWHKCLTRIITAPADFITHSMLGIPAGSLLSRNTRLFLAFSTSGIVHMASDYGLGVSPSQSGAIIFFLLQPVSILLEHQLQNLFTGRLPRAAEKVVGYVWLVIWMSWCAPVWTYPQLRAPGVDSADTLPVRILPKLLRM